MAAADISKSIQHILESAVLNQQVVEVTVPSVADADTGQVIETVTALNTKVGDIVLATPIEALPTDANFTGAYVVDDDDIAFTFSAQDGAITGAAVDFNVTVLRLTV